MNNKTKASVFEKIKRSRQELELLGRTKNDSDMGQGSAYSKKVSSAGEQLRKLDQIVVENPSKLVKYRRNMTVPALWVPTQGIRSVNLEEIPAEKIQGLDQYVSTLVAGSIVLDSASSTATKLTIVSGIKDLRNIFDTNIFQVPDGHIFSIDSMEILTTEISDADQPPTVRFGNSGNAEAYYGPSIAESNMVGERHIIEFPQNGATAGTVVSMGVTLGSTAASHMGVGVVTGYLVQIAAV